MEIKHSKSFKTYKKVESKPLTANRDEDNAQIRDAGCSISSFHPNQNSLAAGCMDGAGHISWAHGS